MKDFTETKYNSGHIITRINDDGKLQFRCEFSARWTDDITNPNITIYGDQPLSHFENFWGYRLQDIDPTAKWVAATKKVAHTLTLIEA